jgi:glutamine amidotransferase
MLGSSGFIGVIDYEIGTWTSVVNMLEQIGVKASVCRNPERLNEFTHVILPGVGNFLEASSKLDELQWRDPLIAKIDSGAPTLGICLGMQLLGRSSEESDGIGLGVMDFKSELLSSDGPFRVPHMGWNSVQIESSHPIFNGWSNDSRFYFVHSFAVPETSVDAIGLSSHNQVFTSVVARNNVVGVQFHPEKSRGYGKKLLENFVEM